MDTPTEELTSSTNKVSYKSVKSVVEGSKEMNEFTKSMKDALKPEFDKLESSLGARVDKVETSVSKVETSLGTRLDNVETSVNVLHDDLADIKQESQKTNELLQKILDVQKGSPSP